jgi:hypothetical protein
MARAARIAVAVVALLGAFGLGVVALSEAGEVVVLHTAGERGEDHTTRLWVVDVDGAAWLRAGQEGSGWYARLRAQPEVQLQRGEGSLPYRAVPVPEASERINAAMAEKYGLADRIIALGRREGGSIAIRLDPATVPPAP